MLGVRYGVQGTPMDDKVGAKVVPGLVGLQAVLADQLFEATLYILSNQ